MYQIRFCTPVSNFLRFPVTPPTGVKMTWEITVTTEDVKIKCNNLEVLHFIFNDTYRDDGVCTKHTQGKIANKVKFGINDTATKMFASGFVSK